MLLLAHAACTGDDICTEGTATTPLLIITFKNRLAPLLSKEVINLTVETDDANSSQVISKITTDSIAIPLNAGTDITKYRFIKDYEDTNSNSDTITFTYSRQDIYVNRACAFKTIYNSFAADLQDEGAENWIFTVNVLTEIIENENQTHINILH